MTLQNHIFPFAEAARDEILAAPGKINYGALNTVEMLIELRPFFWRVSFIDVRFSMYIYVLLF